MIERAGSKKTGDRTLDSMDFNRYQRIRMDLRDCVLPRLPGVDVTGVMDVMDVDKGKILAR